MLNIIYQNNKIVKHKLVFQSFILNLLVFLYLCTNNLIMAFKKLNDTLKQALIEYGLNSLSEFQSKVITAIKGGRNTIIIAGEEKYKSTALVIGILQKVQVASNDDAPRAIIVVENKEKALEMEALFNKLAKRTDLRIVVLHDKGHKVYQRIDLYEGSDILISTQKRLFEMYLQNGVNLGQLKTLVIDGAEAILKQDTKKEIQRMTESISKCQYVLLNNTMTDRIEKSQETFLTFPDILTF